MAATRDGTVYAAAARNKKAVHLFDGVKGELTEDQLNQLAEMREERRERLKEHLGQLQKKLDRMESAD